MPGDAAALSPSSGAYQRTACTSGGVCRSSFVGKFINWRAHTAAHSRGCSGGSGPAPGARPRWDEDQVHGVAGKDSLVVLPFDLCATYVGVLRHVHPTLPKVDLVFSRLHST